MGNGYVDSHQDRGDQHFLPSTHATPPQRDDRCHEARRPLILVITGLLTFSLNNG